jgi:hypothetical protein
MASVGRLLLINEFLVKSRGFIPAGQKSGGQDIQVFLTMQIDTKPRSSTNQRNGNIQPELL